MVGQVKFVGCTTVGPALGVYGHEEGDGGVVGEMVEANF